jgi:hypothetical protein
MEEVPRGQKGGTGQFLRQTDASVFLLFKLKKRVDGDLFLTDLPMVYLGSNVGRKTIKVRFGGAREPRHSPWFNKKSSGPLRLRKSVSKICQQPYDNQQKCCLRRSYFF